jgi:hypothetical protein
MNDFTQLMLYRQLLGGESWSQAVLLGGVILILIFRRDQIVAPYMFRVAILLLMLSYILPTVMMFVWRLSAQNTGGFLPALGNYGWTVEALMAGTGPVTLGLAVGLIALSMLPSTSRYPATKDRPPQPHALD